MTKPFYKEVFKKALFISWKNKFLWIFGFFATFISGGIFEIFIKSSGRLTKEWAVIKLFNIINFFQSFSWTNIKTTAENSPTHLIKLLLSGLLLLGLAILIIWLATVSQMALVRAANLFNKNKKTDLKDSFNSVKPYFWNVLGLNILGKLATFVLLLLLALPLLFQSGSFWLGLLYVLLYLIVIATVLIISFIIIYSVAYVVLKKKKFIESIIDAWRLFIKNWIVSLEVALILFIINILGGFALGILLFVAAIPFILLSVIFYFLSLNVLLGLILILTFIVLLALTILFSSILTCFQISAWTLTFEKLTNKRATSKVADWIKKLLKK